MENTRFLDARGLACPMPIVRAKKEMNDLESGDVLEIHAADKGAKTDLIAWAKAGGHEMLETKDEADLFKFWIKKG